jgi:hypothetical protein
MTTDRVRYVTRKWGEVSIERHEGEPLGSVLEAKGFANFAIVRYVWRPTGELGAQLPPGFELPLACITGPDGLKRFYPVHNFEIFIDLAFTGGLAVLCQQRGLDREQRRTYRAMYLLFRRARRTRERLKKNFRSPRELWIGKSARSGQEKSVLPDSLGNDAAGDGKTWGVDRLMREGMATCLAAGIADPTKQDQIHHGLVAAARRNPLRIQAGEVSSLVKFALFDPTQLTGQKPDPQTVEFVFERTVAAVVSNHFDDDAERFRAWFSGPKNSLLFQITQQKTQPGGQLDRGEVRRALLELAWDAFTYVAQCIDAQLRIFLRIIAEDLGAVENRLFQQMHLQQPHFGDLPLVLLVERFPFLKAVIWEIWQDPADSEAIGTLHRLLDYYRQMTTCRREADRTVKKVRHSPNKHGKAPSHQPCDARIHDGVGTERSAQEDPALLAVKAEIFDRIRIMKNISCRCHHPEWSHHVETECAGSAVMYTCIRCGSSGKAELSPEDKEELRGRFSDE